MHQDSGRDAENSTTKERNATDSRAASDTARRTMHQPEEACSPGVATRLAKRRSMDGAVPSTPPSSGKGKRRDAPSDYRADVSRALDVPAGSSGATDEEMHDRSPRESRSVSSDDADAREDIAAVAREAAVDRKRRDDEEASAAFARLLGDQERAFFVRTNSLPISGGDGGDRLSDGGDRVADETVGGSPDDVFRIEARTTMSLRKDPLVCDANDAHGDVVRYDDSERVRLSRPTHFAADDVSNDARDGDASNDEDASLALARALAEEEQREWQSRMLALAGVGDPADETDEGVDVDGMTYEELTELGEHIGVQSKGASAEAVASLTRFTIGETHAFGTGKKQTRFSRDENLENLESCAVCCMGFERGDACLGMPRCGHAYHAECLEPWLAENKCCPLCKTEIEAEAAA